MKGSGMTADTKGRDGKVAIVTGGGALGRSLGVWRVGAKVRSILAQRSGGGGRSGGHSNTGGEAMTVQGSVAETRIAAASRRQCSTMGRIDISSTRSHDDPMARRRLEALSATTSWRPIVKPDRRLSDDPRLPPA